MSTALSGYESWVRSNQKWFLPLLDTARSLTLFLPGRFSETELQSEAIYCGLNLISAYHDSILDRPRAVTCELKCGPVTPHITRLQHILQFLHYSEVMIEMMASRWSKGQVIISNTNTPMQKLQSWRGRREVKWIVVLMVEMIKAFCRLQMLRNNNGKMLITMTNEELVTAAAMRARERKKAASLSKWAAQHPEMPIPPALPFSDLIDMYVRHGRSQVNPHGKFLPESVTKHPRERDDFTPRVKEVLGEVLYILRPVAYVTGRLLCHDSSWRPFLLSLFIDIASRLCIDKFDELSPGERAELSRRMIMWSFYLLRSPLFERFTQFPLIRISQVLSRIPLFGLFFGNILDLIFSLQSHYFYTSAS